MALYAPPIKSAPQGDPVSAGTHRAICYAVVDLGHQQATNFDGQAEVQHQVLLMFELSDERMDDGRPRGMSRKVKLSVHEKSTLRGILHALSGRKLSDAEALATNLADLVGKGCLLAVEHNKSPDGSRTYANIKTFSPLMKGMTTGDPENHETVYEIENGAPPSTLPKWVAETIAKSEEAQGRSGKPANGMRPPGRFAELPPDDNEDVIPY